MENASLPRANTQDNLDCPSLAPPSASPYLHIFPTAYPSQTANQTQQLGSFRHFAQSPAATPRRGRLKPQPPAISSQLFHILSTAHPSQTANQTQQLGSFRHFPESPAAAAP